MYSRSPSWPRTTSPPVPNSDHSTSGSTMSSTASTPPSAKASQRPRTAATLSRSIAFSISRSAVVLRAVEVSWPPAGEYSDIRYELSGDGIAKVTIDRPEVRNAFRPQTLVELSDAFERARESLDVGVIVLTGAGDEAFCSGGDQRVRGDAGYLGDDEAARRGVGRFHVTDLQVQIRRLPKPVVAMVAGYAIGGGHSLHIVCNLSTPANNRRSGQAGPMRAPSAGAFGAAVLPRL